jgi:hypothetical protein
MDNCTYCEEWVLAGEQHQNYSEPMHIECGFRVAGGSVAHILRRCSCYKMGAKLEDPPALTKRQAARAALDLFRQIEEWYGDEAAAA